MDDAEQRARREAERVAAQSRELARLEERERIAMDLHDGVIQSLYGVVLSLGALQLTMGAADDAGPGVGQAIVRLNGVIQEIRNNIFDLRLGNLGEQSLRAGIEVLAEELRVNALARTHVEIEHGVERYLGRDGVANLLYLVREATSNVARHAGASVVMIRLCEAGNALELAVSDNGWGFGPSEADRPGANSLRNIRERARLLGGEGSINSAPGKGTTVQVRIPLPPVAGA